MALLQDRRWENHIFDGSWRPATSSAPVHEPATGGVLAQVGQATAADVAASAEKAEAAQRERAATAPTARREVLLRAAELIKTHYDELAEWVVRETGAVQAKAETELLAMSVPECSSK